MKIIPYALAMTAFTFFSSMDTIVVAQESTASMVLDVFDSSEFASEVMESAESSEAGPIDMNDGIGDEEVVIEDLLAGLDLQLDDEVIDQDENVGTQGCIPNAIGGGCRNNAVLLKFLIKALFKKLLVLGFDFSNLDSLNNDDKLLFFVEKLLHFLKKRDDKYDPSDKQYLRSEYDYYPKQYNEYPSDDLYESNEVIH